MTEPNTPAALRFGAVILAAGASTRMGEPKQLLLVQGKPLLARTIEAVLSSAAWPVVVVLGANAEKIRPHVAKLPVLIVENPHWQEGMASSLRAGLETLLRFSITLDAALITVCDQPFFSGSAITRLQAAFTARDQIAAASYAGKTGAPALFGRDYFSELRALSGDAGARALLQKHADHVNAVPLPELASDLDTPEDYQRLTTST